MPISRHCRNVAHEGGQFPVRKRLYHSIPDWVPEGALFFVTVNCQRRGKDQLTVEPVAIRLLETAAYYHEQQKWHVSLLLLMPDHLHAILSFPTGTVVEELIRSWKRFTARELGIGWQTGFFDHRLRSPEEEDLKHDYIRQNPVRQGLCAKPQDWPYQLHWGPEGLVAGAW